MSFRASLIRKSLMSASFLGLVFIVSPVIADSETAKPADQGEENSDPFESINRVTYGFNSFFRGVILDPLVDGYKMITPEPLQEGIGNAVSNLSEPATAVSSVLEGDMENASKATKRFLVNTTVGVGGLSDPATEMGMEQRKEDLGQAAAVNGAEAGPYIVIPFLGPSNTRDLAGNVLTSLVNPLPVVGQMAAGGIEYSNHKDDLNEMTSGSLDPYAVERSAYQQHRTYQINNGKIQDMDIPDLSDSEDFKSE